MFRARNVIHEHEFDRLAEAAFGSMELADEQLGPLLLTLASAEEEHIGSGVVCVLFIGAGVSIDYSIDPRGNLILLSMRLVWRAAA